MTVPQPKPISIYAHRGFWANQFPENSREAFAYATQQGFRSECDVWTSADGQPIVIHDETLDRTTTGVGAVLGFTASELQEFRCRCGEQLFSPPPQLLEVAQHVGLVEIKPYEDAALVQRVVEIMADRDWILQSFDPNNLLMARGLTLLEPQLPRPAMALLIEDEASIPHCLDFEYRIHLEHTMLNDRLARDLRKAGLPIGAWTVNTEPDIKRVLDLGASTIISDHPDLVKQIAEQRGFICQ
jgi:glycerophosphoryl diester phosphodiesterase